MWSALLKDARRLSISSAASDIRQANQIAAAAEYAGGPRRTLKQKYGYGDLAERYVDLAKELLQKLEMDA